MMTIKEFSDGWKHFCECINFAESGLDSEAIRFMNEMPNAVSEGLTEDQKQVGDEIAATKTIEEIQGINQQQGDQKPKTEVFEGNNSKPVQRPDKRDV